MSCSVAELAVEQAAAPAWVVALLACQPLSARYGLWNVSAQ